MKGIAFDLEGTIIDIESAHHLGHLSAALEIGLHLSLEEAINTIPAFIGGPDEKIAVELCRRANNKIEPHELLKRMHFFFKQNLKTMTIQPRTGFTNIISKILSIGFPVAIGTLTCKSDALYLMELSGITKYFPKENLVYGEDVKEKKPSPEVYIKTAQRMGINPKKQIVFEDSVPGIEAAKLAGSIPLAVPVIETEEYLHRLVAAGAKQVFRSWSDVKQYCVMN